MRKSILSCLMLLTVLTHPLAVGSINASADNWQTETTRLPVSFSSTSDSVRLTVQPGTRKQHRIILSPARDGDLLQVIQQTREENGSWKRESLRNLLFWPSEARNLAVLEEDEVERQSCLNRSLRLRLDYEDTRWSIWLEGQMIASLNWEEQPESPFEISTTGNAVVGSSSAFSRKEIDEHYELVELPGINPAEISSELIHVNGIPFEVWDNGNRELSLEHAGWPDVQRDPAGFNQAYDGGPYFIGDPRMPFTQVRNDYFTHAYVLAYAEDKPDTINRFTLRIGRRVGGYGDQSQVVTRDYTAEVPLGKSDLQYDQFHLIKVPLHELFPLLVEGDVLDIEITKEIRLARRSPDPNSFRWRPLGLTSNVKIAAITLEKSPLQMDVQFANYGNVFEQGSPAQATITLSNRTNTDIEYMLEVDDTSENNHQYKDTLSSDTSIDYAISVPNQTLGVYPFRATLTNTSNQTLLDYETSYGILPGKERQYRAESSIGLGGAGGGRHFTPMDHEKIAQLYELIGMHYINSLTMTAEMRERYGLRQGYVISMRPGNGGSAAILERREERIAEHPDQLPQLLVFHEDGISGSHATRIPDIFHDRPPYQLNEEERTRFSMMYDEAVRTGELFRKHHPDVQIQLGNGSLVVREEFYRHQFPSELFDSGGNENPSFSRIPEVQPPDMIGNNSSLWMDRQLLNHYGYADKVVTQCHETIFPSTNPGNLSLSTHANYLVRHYLHSLAWEMPQIRGGGLFDKGNSYKNSNWGQTGLFTARPDIAPKPAALQMAVFTKVMDGAKYEGFLDTGSESTYLMRFRLKDNRELFPFWTVRGLRDLHLELQGSDHLTLVSSEGEEQTLSSETGEFTVQASASVSYIQIPEDASLRILSLGIPQYPDSQPSGQTALVDTLGDLEKWEVQEEKNPLLEFYTPLTPRRKGNFQIESVAQFEGREDVLRITPLPLDHGKPTMPMYTELRANSPILLPGQPVEVGLWVNGNSSWGRIIFELKDASGQQWTSIGARSKRGGTPWMADWLGKELADQYEPGEKADWNTDDAWGLSRINFDGWRYLGIPLPGNYPGEHYPWPANSQWRWDKDGVVHYPLTVTAIFIELPEKTLHLKRYEAPRRKEIYIHNLMSVENDQMHSAKSVAEEAVDSKQVHID